MIAEEKHAEYVKNTENYWKMHDILLQPRIYSLKVKKTDLAAATASLNLFHYPQGVILESILHQTK